MSALYAITPPIVGGPGALIPLVEWRHCIKAEGPLDILLCIVALTGNRHYSSVIKASISVAFADPPEPRQRGRPFLVLGVPQVEVVGCIVESDNTGDNCTAS